MFYWNQVLKSQEKSTYLTDKIGHEGAIGIIFNVNRCVTWLIGPTRLLDRRSNNDVIMMKKYIQILIRRVDPSFFGNFVVIFFLGCVIKNLYLYESLILTKNYVAKETRQTCTLWIKQNSFVLWLSFNMKKKLIL